MTARRAGVAPRKAQQRWTVVFPDGKYLSSPRGGKGVAWTHDRAEADNIASGFGGRVVDADKLCADPSRFIKHRLSRAGGTAGRKGRKTT